MIIKESQSLEQIMPAVYNKLKSLGEINNVVPLDKIIKGLQSGSARAFVSNKDRNQDGIPDNINIGSLSRAKFIKAISLSVALLPAEEAVFPDSI